MIYSICDKRVKHGMAYKHPLYRRWKAMRSRCNNKNNKDYVNYGGRGIIVCSEWDDYGKFYDDNINEYDRCRSIYQNETLTVERIDADNGYIKGNITFIPNRLQANNKRVTFKFDVIINGNKLGTFNGLRTFCRDRKLKYDIILYYAKRKTTFDNQGYTFNIISGGKKL